MNGFNPRKVLRGVFFDLEWTASGDKKNDGFPVAAPVYFQPLKEAFVFLVRPTSRVELDPM